MSCCAPRRRFAWIGPLLLLAVIPKCPACLAAYLACAGISLSISAAGALRIALILGSIAALAYFLIRQRR